MDNKTGGEQAGASMTSQERTRTDLTVSWRRLCSPFPGRDGHCAASIGGRLYVFGGVAQVQIDEHCESNELLSFEPGKSLTNVWSIQLYHSVLPLIIIKWIILYH